MASVELTRQATAKPLPLTDVFGNPLTYNLPDEALRMLHVIDQGAAGRLGTSEVVTNPGTRDRYIVSSMIEEAIKSSQLEGASTSRAVAKDMIRSGRRPATRDEQMIFNNYRAMEYVRHLDRPLTIDVILELHRIVALDALDDPADAGRLQSPDEERVKIFNPRGDILHRPPPAENLPRRLESLCAFANGHNDERFVHPIVRAIVTHFCLAYEHPFVDGNGRTARALFYWSMLSQGYWLSEFLAISSILRRAPAKYARSFLYVETDDGDLTYFILYQLSVICRAIDALNDYLDRKVREVQEAEALARGAAWLNHRQLALLSHALRHPGSAYTYNSHARSHGVVRQTARADLLQLADAGLLKQSKRGRELVFRPVQGISERLRGAR